MLIETRTFGSRADGPFGIAYYGRTRSRYASTRSKKRVVEPAPRSEWIAVPVPLHGLGPGRAEVEGARRSIDDNHAPSEIGDSFWELSRGFVFCAECGRSMRVFGRRFPGSRPDRFYYRCEHGVRRRTPVCPHVKSHPAEDLEYQAASLFEQSVTYETLLDLYDRALEDHDERHDLSRTLERRAALVERLSELDLERKGHLEQNARGLISDAELDAMLAEVGEQREAIAAELRAVEDEAAAARRIEEARESL